MISEGSAFLDRSGRVLAMDASFRAQLRLGAGDPSVALHERARTEPALSSLLAGEGPDAARLAGSEERGESGCELTRVPGSGGLLLHARRSAAALPAPAIEYAMQALALARLAASVSHEVKNPLNAMALQVALLGDKIGSSSEALATACANNLASLKTQIGRVNEVVRRFLDVADPAPASSFDAGALLADAAVLFVHEARRRRFTLSCDASGGSVRAHADPARTARLIVGLLWRAVAGTPEGGSLVASAHATGEEAVLALEGAPGTLAGPLAWIGGVAAASAGEMGGRLVEMSSEVADRVVLVLPRELS